MELNALVNPIELWADVASTTATNLGTIAGMVLANPAPILGKMLENGLISGELFAAVATKFVSGFANGVGMMPQQIQDSLTSIVEGDVYQGVINLATAFLAPVVQGAFGALMYLPDIITVLQNPFLNTASVIETGLMKGILGVGFPLLTQVLVPAAQIGLTGQAIFDGIQAGDFEAVANAVISFPSDMVNSVLNGTPPEVGVPGLLGPGGLIQGLLKFREDIADAIHAPVLTPPPTAKVSTAPDLQAKSFTITTAAPESSAPKTATEPESGSGTAADDGGQAPAVDPGKKLRVTRVPGGKALRPAADGARTAGDEAAKPAKKSHGVKKSTGAKSKKASTPSGGGGEE